MRVLPVGWGERRVEQGESEDGMLEEEDDDDDLDEEDEISNERHAK